MKTQRISELFSQLDADQVLLTDMNNVYYFSGELIYPGSRILPVILKRNGSAVFFLNRLYEAKFRGAEGMEVVRFSDTDDLPALLAHHLDSFACLAVDGKMASSHLLAIQALGAASGYIDASRAVSRVRGRKDAQEIALMKEASRINDLAMDRFKKLVKPGVSEKQVAEKIEGIYRELGADSVSFNPIVCFGSNSADPHHKPDDTVIKEGDCVLFDVGCKKDNYCSDMTRTFFYRSAGESERKVYDIVKAANAAGKAAIKPRVRFCDIDRAARSLIEEAGYGPNFTHRLGHSIGMDLHEPGDANQINTDRVLPGNIFSCEPGIYLPGRFGIRIEDLCLVTEDGMESLNSYPRELELIG